MANQPNSFPLNPGQGNLDALLAYLEQVDEDIRRQEVQQRGLLEYTHEPRSHSPATPTPASPRQSDNLWGVNVFGAYPDAPGTSEVHTPYVPTDSLPDLRPNRFRHLKKQHTSPNVFRRHPWATAGAAGALAVATAFGATHARGLLSSHNQNAAISFSEGAVPPSAKATKFNLPKGTLVGMMDIRVDSSYEPMYKNGTTQKQMSMQLQDKANGVGLLLDIVDARTLDVSLGPVGSKSPFAVSPDGKTVYVDRSGLGYSISGMPVPLKSYPSCAVTPNVGDNKVCFQGLPKGSHILPDSTKGIDAKQANIVSGHLATNPDGSAADPSFVATVDDEGMLAALASDTLLSCLEANEKKLADEAVASVIEKVAPSTIIFKKGTAYKPWDVSNWTKGTDVASRLAQKVVVITGTGVQCSNLQAPQGGN